MSNNAHTTHIHNAKILICKAISGRTSLERVCERHALDWWIIEVCERQKFEGSRLNFLCWIEEMLIFATYVYVHRQTNSG